MSDKGQPPLAAFPKAYMDELCVTGEMTLERWIEMASALDVDGLELYSGIRGLETPPQWEYYRRVAADHGMQLPMLCCSPDFTHPDPKFRAEQIELEKEWIDMAAGLGAAYCRVLSGQRRPEVSVDDGIAYCTDCIEACLDHAADRNVTLILENHYKDNFWEHPEFAQKMDIFLRLIEQIDSPHFGVNYDPSNTYLAGEDPLELLRCVRKRVVTMHASDRYLAEGTLEDLRREEDVVGYAQRLRHGTIGKGLNDYDAIFSLLAEVGFRGWISIEDGVDGMDQMHESVAYLRGKLEEHWPAS
ncbi:MAG: sugar phosphate isomerase/epimerase family protein [Planctomycetota bacterium]|nr:sugar phosphate isomerase/epimerase family protein [Planctomycetota bacterium]